MKLSTLHHLPAFLAVGLLLAGAGCGGSMGSSAPATFGSSTQAKATWDSVVDSPLTNYLYQDQQWHLRKINAFSAWTVTQGNPDLIVAVIDTGVDYNHPALAGRVVKGLDYADNDADPMDDVPDGSDTKHPEGHGTHVSGIIAADGDVKGVAPKVKIMALKVFSSKPGDGGANSSNMAKAILYAAQHGASVINMSIGADTMYRCSVNDQLDSAINEAYNRGVSVVVASGNSAFDHVRSQCSTLQKNINVIPVNATDEQDHLATFSNFSNGDHPRSISAPGVHIYSTVPIAKMCDGQDCKPPFDYMQGTSMASPVVAGTLALIKSAMYDDYKNLMTKQGEKPLSLQEFFHTQQRAAQSALHLSIPPSQLAERLLFSYTSIPNSHDPANLSYDAYRDPLLGYGRVDAGAAVKAASQVFTAYLGDQQAATSSTASSARISSR